MRRFILFFYVICLPFSVFSNNQQLKINDISDVMQRLLVYHVEHKQVTPLLVKRMLKIYIDQFDPHKIYLLQSEVLPYLTIKDKQCQMIVSRLLNNDYSDFEKLSELFFLSIERSKRMRKNLTFQTLANIDIENLLKEYDEFAENENTLNDRITRYFANFYQFHQKRSNLDSNEKKHKVLQLSEKKMDRSEMHYSQTGDKREYFFVLNFLKAFAKCLDAHTAFFSSEEASEMRKNLEKQYEGLGIILSEGVDGVMITDLIKNSPADLSNQIQINDRIVRIDNEKVEKISFEEILEKLKRRDRLSISLGLISLTEPNNLKEVTLRYAPIVLEDERLTFESEPFGDGVIGKLTLNAFYENANGISCEKDIIQAIETLKKQKPLKGLVLDLRKNGGGFLSQAVKVASLFISKGVIVISKYGELQTKVLRSTNNKPYFSGPIIILTSQLSASASEIVAQALQDYGVALIVGDQRTFGKGSIQYQTITDEKSQFYYKVTVGKYFTVSGKSTQINGVIADIVVPSEYHTYSFGERFLEYPLKAEQIKSMFVDPLEDIDFQSKRWFQENYLPYLQKKKHSYKQIISILKHNSEHRLKNDANFQLFLHKNDGSSKKNKGSYGVEDLQMIEAINILKDMIFLQKSASNF